MKPLSGLDAAFLHLETPETPMHVGSLHLYQVPGRGRAGYFERARRHIGARLHLVPVFTRRLASAPFDVASPVWVEDREVDLDRHVRRIRLRKPGTMAQLEAEVARLHGELLDRGRPLWMFYVIEGLATGEVAWYSKIHHATLDGSAGVQLAAALLDVSATPRKVAKPARRALEESPGAAAVLGAAIAKSAGEFGKLLRALPEVARVAGSGVDAIAALGAAAGERGKGGKDGRRGKSGGTGLPIGPSTALNGPIGRERAFATASIPLAQAKAIAKRHGAKLNDVVLALVSGALRRYLASHDALTRLPNRAFFMERLAQGLGAKVPARQGLAVLFLDLDGFKAINDTHGHAAGDELLRVVATRLARAVREDDTVSRLGGDEFACLLNGLATAEHAVASAMKLRDAIRMPCRIGDRLVQVGVSIGVSLCPVDGTTSEELLLKADMAMYRAKRASAGVALYGDGG